MLDARWLSLKRKSGITEFDLALNLIDAPTAEYNPGDPFPFWAGHELTYRRFYENAVELLEVLNQPIKDPGPIPFLDTLDASDNDPATTGPQTNGRAPEAPATGPLVILGERGDQPRVNGRIKPRLTFAQYDVVKALLDAGDGGLKKDALEEKSGHTDAVNILKRLCNSDADWKSVTLLAGRSGGRYRISQ